MYKQPDLAKRQTQSAEARQKLLAKFRSRTMVDTMQAEKSAAKANGS